MTVDADGIGTYTHVNAHPYAVLRQHSSRCVHRVHEHIEVSPPECGYIPSMVHGEKASFGQGNSALWVTLWHIVRFVRMVGAIEMCRVHGVGL